MGGGVGEGGGEKAYRTMPRPKKVFKPTHPALITGFSQLFSLFVMTEHRWRNILQCFCSCYGKVIFKIPNLYTVLEKEKWHDKFYFSNISKKSSLEASE